MKYSGATTDMIKNKKYCKNGLKAGLPFIFLIMLVLFSSCAEEGPVNVDGNASVCLKAVWNDSRDSSTHYTAMPNAKVIMTSEYGAIVKYTNAEGVLDLSGLPSAEYSISVRMSHPLDPNINLVGTKLAVKLLPGRKVTDTIYAKPISSSGIAINELYVCGPVNTQFYFYDLFIELYNMSDSVKYLDGMMVMRFTGGDSGLPGADIDNDGDIEYSNYVFKFPGNPGEKNYPFPPKKFLTIAAKAIDHRKFVSTSIDLSNADWEFYNQYSTADIDNPAVPNLTNMRPDRTSEFLLSLTADVVIISDGRDSKWDDGIDISTIIDGVEYQSDAKQIKTLVEKVDRGFVLSPPNYSGKSMQRREPGVDTNDGTLDWGIISKPTPGYQ